ncbi:MAG: metalloregulator ArsR/SmtB family transcription factor [Burkholderiales bacterium]
MLKPDEVSRAFSALAQQSRLAALHMLVTRHADGMCPGDLSRELGIVPATLSFHLKALTSAGLISAQPNGRQLIYRADLARIRALSQYLTETCGGSEAARCFGDLDTPKNRINSRQGAMHD